MHGANQGFLPETGFQLHLALVEESTGPQCTERPLLPKSHFGFVRDQTYCFKLRFGQRTTDYFPVMLFHAGTRASTTCSCYVRVFCRNNYGICESLHPFNTTSTDPNRHGLLCAHSPSTLGTTHSTWFTKCPTQWSQVSCVRSPHVAASGSSSAHH